MKIVDNEKLIPVLRELIQQGKSVNLLISGSSMSPFLIHHRDYIIFEKPEKPLKRGNMVFYQRPNGAYVMHRIHHIDKKGNLFIIGDAQTQIEGPVDQNCVFGIVTKVKRKGKLIGPGDFWWEFFEHIWIHMIPVRHFITKIYGIQYRIRSAGSVKNKKS